MKNLFTAILTGLMSVISLSIAQANDWEAEWSNQLRTLTKEEYVINAMEEFASAISKVREENGLDSVDDLKKELFKFYQEGFAKEYANQTGSEYPELQALLEPLDDDSIALQHYYMAANPHPIGSKHLLDQADDKSTWSQLHGKFHPKFRSYLEEQELYDIFLVDLESGDMVYSVFKEVDFTTSISEGPYADVFREAFLAVKDSTDKDFVAAPFNAYVPSYEAIAYFFLTSIYNGDEKVGILMIQVPFA